MLNSLRCLNLFLLWSNFCCYENSHSLLPMISRTPLKLSNTRSSERELNLIRSNDNSSCCSKMTKLMEWLFFGVLFLSLWISLITKKINHYILEEYSTVVLYLPVILAFLFAVYAATVVLWRVYTFNDCEEAAEELKQQIEEAKKDLKARGFQFQQEETS